MTMLHQQREFRTTITCDSANSGKVSAEVMVSEAPTAKFETRYELLAQRCRQHIGVNLEVFVILIPYFQL